MAVAGGISLYELTVFCYTGKRIFTASGKYIKRVSEAHTILEIRRAPQVRACYGAANQTHSKERRYACRYK